MSGGDPQTAPIISMRPLLTTLYQDREQKQNKIITSPSDQPLCSIGAGIELALADNSVPTHIKLCYIARLQMRRLGKMASLRPKAPENTGMLVTLIPCST